MYPYSPYVPNSTQAIIKSSRNTSNKSRKAAEIMPACFPLELVMATNLTCIYQAIDENTSNTLNADSEFITVRFTTGNGNVTFTYYSGDLLKKWLKELAATDLFGREIHVVKTTTKTFNNVKTRTNNTIKVRCLQVPSEEQIERCTDLDYDAKRAYMFAAVQIRKYLLRPDRKDVYLIEPDNIVFNAQPDSTMVTTPTNIAKLDRLVKLGFNKLAIRDEEKERWKRFHSAETERYNYVSQLRSGSTVTDSVLRSLPDSQCLAYNNMAINDFATSNGAFYPDDENMPIIRQRVSKGSIINPGVLQYQKLNNEARNNKSANSENITYKDMIKVYRTLTGTLLDINTEKQQKLLDTRLHDIGLIQAEINSGIRRIYVHNKVTNRIQCVDSIPQSNQQQYNSNTPQQNTTGYVSNALQPFNNFSQVINQPQTNDRYISGANSKSRASPHEISNYMRQGATVPMNTNNSTSVNANKTISSMGQIPIIPSFSNSSSSVTNMPTFQKSDTENSNIKSEEHLEDDPYIEEENKEEVLDIPETLLED